jgi:hypothetical protein
MASCRRTSGDVDGSPQIDDEHHTRRGGGIVERAVWLAVVEHEDVIGSVVLNLQYITKLTSRNVTCCEVPITHKSVPLHPLPARTCRLWGYPNTDGCATRSSPGPPIQCDSITVHRWQCESYSPQPGDCACIAYGPYLRSRPQFAEQRCPNRGQLLKELDRAGTVSTCRGHPLSLVRIICGKCMHQWENRPFTTVVDFIS